jgi:hypothetical protein
MHVYFKSENGSYLPNSPSPLSGFLQACGQSIMLYARGPSRFLSFMYDYEGHFTPKILYTLPKNPRKIRTKSGSIWLILQNPNLKFVQIIKSPKME